jgi:hypothetical protein
MRCASLIDRQPHPWVDDSPFLLWEIGMKTILEHWADHLYETNHRMILWLDEIDSRVLNFVSGTYPLCRNVTIRIGVPEGKMECCTFIDADGGIVLSPGSELIRYLPPQPAARTWFKVVGKWLENLRDKGSSCSELEREIKPGVFIGHHCRISRTTEFIAPCWVGSGAEVTGARIGPHAVVGENAIVSRGTSVADSYVLRDTFVGEHLTLGGVVAGNGKLLDHQTAVTTPVHDRTILSVLSA